MELKRVFAATDLSAAGDEVLCEADRIARARHAELIVFHALPTYVRAEPFFPQSALLTNEAFVSLERQVLERLSERSAAITGRAPATLDLELGFGLADEEIVSHGAARHADLIAVGGAGPPRLPRALLGAVAENVVRQAHSSVLVVRPHTRRQRVLVATDFSNAATLAVTAAVVYARLDGSRLWALHVLHDPDHRQGAPFPTWGSAELSTLARRAAQKLATGLEAVGATGGVMVAPGEPAAVIVEQARALDAGCIVLGTTGQTGFKLSRLGSVAEAVVRSAPCSVLVVRMLTS